MATKGSGACTPCPAGQFARDKGSTSRMECPSSEFNLDGWWCMTSYEKIVLIALWFGSFISCILTIWKIRKFVVERIKKIEDAGFAVTFKNFISPNIYLSKNKLLISLIDNENQRMIPENIVELREIILQLHKDVQELKNK